MRAPIARVLAAVLASLLITGQGTVVLAGTTGGLAGTILDAVSGRPIPGAAVTATSPSQSATVSTDRQGRYGFVSLAPDTYALAVSAPGYAPFSQPGITVVADQTQTYDLKPARELAQIGRTRARTATDLVRPGQTADVYSVSGQLSQNAQALGGGGSLFQTFAALQSVPGVYVPQNANYGQNTAAPYIRGGDYNQVGFEFDGIPVNRAFDNYVSNTQGVTGQQELQAYTGGVPASSAGEGLSGYINQVVKSGTHPAAGSAEGVLGAPSFYHYLRGEYGGAAPNRSISYYVATTGWNQALRVGDQFNGGGGIGDLLFSAYAAPGAGPGAIRRVPFDAGAQSNISTRESVLNLHLGIPHRNGDGGRDDVQFLGQIGRQFFQAYDSFNDYGGITNPAVTDITGGPGPFAYPHGYVVDAPLFAPFDPAAVRVYRYPYTPTGGPVDAQGNPVIDPNLRGTIGNDNGIFKAQYQKNFGSRAYLRLYGYTNFSSWTTVDPPYAYLPFSVVGNFDYELKTHTRGAALEFADQLTARHLLQGSASYTFANVTRANDTTMLGKSSRAQLLDADGRCYDPASGALTNCYAGLSLTGGYTQVSLAAAGGVPAPVVGDAAAAGAAYRVAATGRSVTFNTVTPKFSALSLSDQWQVSDRLKLDLGLRWNGYVYGLSDTGPQALAGGPNGEQFAIFNREHCYDPATRAISTASAASGYACAAGRLHTDLSNVYPGNVASTVLEPRLGGTFSLSPYDVLRFSAGAYSQPVNSAYVQYNLAGDVPAYLAGKFFGFGYTTPRHDLAAQRSLNADLSYEKRFANAPLSFTFSPFYRHTNRQNQQFFLDPATNFASGLNVGALRAFGFELLGRYGDFNRDGVSAQLSFAYTNSKIRYTNFPGTNLNLIDLINQQLVPGYNALTAAGGGSPCYTTATAAGAALAGGTCPAGTIANPYYGNAPVAGLDPSAYYSPYTITPAASQGLFAAGSASSYEVPSVLTALVQVRRNGWRFVPTLEYDAGFRYSNPFTWVGYDPSAVVGGPGSCPDPVACAAAGNLVFRPNPYTGRFDGLGDFRGPSTLTLSAQIAKDLGPRVTVTAILANLYTHCFTHGYAWEQGGSRACFYGGNTPYAAGGVYLGNARTPGVPLARLQSDPFGYAPGGLTTPFSAFLSLQVKL